MNYLLQIEFRYTVTLDNDETEYKNKIITIWVYNTIKQAIENWNKELLKLESRYEKNIHYPLSRFSENKKLITNLAYLTTPFTFFFSITELKYKDLDIVLDNIKKELTN